MSGFSFLHCSDLHIGRRLYGFSLLPDQRHVLAQIVELARAERVDAVVIAGDFFDSPTPSAEAVAVADLFLSELTAVCPVLLTAGNHDSPERLQFGSRLFAQAHLHIAALAQEKPLRVTFEDAYGPVVFDLLPFLRASAVRPFFPEDQLVTCQDAVAAVLAGTATDPATRRLLVAHQFIVGADVRPAESESEMRFVGGSGEIDAGLFQDYIYVALGHLHGQQSIGATHIRYSGSPLPYSFSEINHTKGALLVTLDGAGVRSIERKSLQPLRAMTEMSGLFADVLHEGERLRMLGDTKADAYTRVILDDDVIPPDATNRLRGFLPYLVTVERRRRQADINRTYVAALPNHDPLAQFADFYREQTGGELSLQQVTWLTEAMSRARQPE